MDDHQVNWFAGVDEVVSEPVKFKLRLAIGEDAYTSLRVKKAVFEVWDTFSAASSAATIAKSSFIASTFFPSTGLLSVIGMGTATTPVGWVIGAAVLTGGAWVGITRYLREQTDARAKVIPEFINTPLDVIGLALFDLMAPLALKVAHVEGAIDQSEMEKIAHWFVRQWGYDPTFVKKGLNFSSTCLDEVQIADVATALAQYKRESPDCNYRAMSQELLRFLREVMEADGIIDEREELAIAQISRIFEEEARTHLGRKFLDTAATARNAVAEGASLALDSTVSGASRLGLATSNAVGNTFRRGADGVSSLRAKLARRKKLFDPHE